MSGTDRKRSSKWDLRDELEFAPGSKQMRSGRSSANAAGSNSSKLYYSEPNDTLKPVKGFSSEESFSGGSGSNKDDVMHKEHRVIDATKEWETDGSRHQKMSPRIEEWKQKSHSQSPENGWSRSVRSSQSRSPPKSGRSNGPCINFAKGRCRMGTSCKFVHHNNSDGYGKVYMDELTREKDMDRRRRDSSFEQGGGHGPNRTSDTPCKFFANGNCRNGKYCRFSHDSQLYRSPNRRFGDDRRASNPGGDHQMLDRQRPSDFSNPIRRPKDDRWGSDVNVANTVQIRDSPKRNDTVALYDTAKLIEDKSGNEGATEPGFTAWPRDRSYHGLDKSQVQDEPPFLSDKKEADSWRAENTDNMHGSQSIPRDILLGDTEMSPDWNYRMGSSCQIEEQGQNKHGISQRGTYLATSEQDRIQVAPGQGFNQNVNHLHTSNYHAVEQSQVAVPIVSNLPSTGGIVDATHNKQVSTQEKYTVEPDIMDPGLSQVSSRSPPTPNTVRNEQLAQLTNLSASLAHILGAGQQLPQLYAALNSQDLKDTPVTKTEVPAMSVSDTCIKPDAVVGFPEQYDPICDSMEPKNADVSGMLPTIPPSKKIAGDEAEIPPQLSNSGRQICGDSFRAASSELVKSDHLIQLQPGQNTEVNKGNNEVVAEGRQNSQDDTKENAPSKKMDQNDGPDEAKKTKDVKGIRPFKFALVEFVKELLKPTWKEGQITKEDYKSIVKKVVDKVTGTMQEAQIPQTQEKIDLYLSCSKPKLNKLVQAYVEKVQKKA